MPLISSPTSSLQAASLTAPAQPKNVQAAAAFQGFVGETFFGLMLKSLRETSDGVAYLDGGQAEKFFRQQLDQHIAERLATTHAKTISEPLFEQFELIKGRDTTTTEANPSPNNPDESIDVRV